MKNIKVLLVDDETEFVQTLADRLRMRDLNPDVAYNGEEALTLAEENQPDVVILDVKMPGLDGIEVLKRIRKAYPKIEVIILTGHGTEEDEKKARQLGAFDYLRKPVDISNLVARVAKAFSQRMEDMNIAATFAEAGEFDAAREIMEKDEEKEG